MADEKLFIVRRFIPLDEREEAPPEPIEEAPTITEGKEVFYTIRHTGVPYYEPRLAEVLELQTPSLPYYVAWLKPIIDYFGKLAESIVNYFEPVTKGLENIGNFFKDPIGNIAKGLGQVFAKSTEESIQTTINAVDVVVSDSPTWKKDLEEKLTTNVDNIVGGILKDVSPDTLGESPLKPADAAKKLNIIGGVVKASAITVGIADILAEAGTLGQLEGIGRFYKNVIDPLGLNTFSSAMVTLPLEPLVMIPAKQYWYSQFTPLIPEADILINMVVKEKITLDEFIELMKYQGFSSKFSNLIWDAHFIPPALSQLLVSYHRGNLTEAELTNLQILVDLDPEYNAIWKDQWYDDPSITQTRFMFETGAIGQDTVRELVKRSGIIPDYIEPMSNFIIRFQERIWRRRYLITMAGGYRQGVFTPDELTNEILDAGYTEGVANWMIRTEDIRRKIEEAKVAAPREALITMSYATDAYIHDDVNEDWLRGYFGRKRYNEEDIEIAIKVLSRKRAAFLAKVGGV